MDWGLGFWKGVVFFCCRILEDVIFRNRRFVRLLSCHLHTTSFTSRLVLTLHEVSCFMDPLVLGRLCWLKLLLTIQQLLSLGLLALSLCRSTSARYSFLHCLSFLLGACTWYLTCLPFNCRDLVWFVMSSVLPRRMLQLSSLLMRLMPSLLLGSMLRLELIGKFSVFSWNYLIRWGQEQLIVYWYSDVLFGCKSDLML